MKSIITLALLIFLFCPSANADRFEHRAIQYITLQDYGEFVDLSFKVDITNNGPDTGLSIAAACYNKDDFIILTMFFPAKFIKENNTETYTTVRFTPKNIAPEIVRCEITGYKLM